MSSYALQPFRPVGGRGLSPAEEASLQRWVYQNLAILVGYWDGRIEYTEDAIEALRPI